MLLTSTSLTVPTLKCSNSALFQVHELPMTGCGLARGCGVCVFLLGRSSCSSDACIATVSALPSKAEKADAILPTARAPLSPQTPHTNRRRHDNGNNNTSKRDRRGEGRHAERANREKLCATGHAQHNTPQRTNRNTTFFIKRNSFPFPSRARRKSLNRTTAFVWTVVTVAVGAKRVETVTSICNRL
jgi:hypothetical protein